jgi:hypothetical protein
MTNRNAPEKWQLAAWPRGEKRFKPKPGAKYPSQQVSNHLFRRDYDSPVAASRAASQVHRRFPDAVLEIVHFKFEGFAWFEQGDRETLYWCPCGGRLDFHGPDMWICLQCRDEWADETVRPECRAAADRLAERAMDVIDQAVSEGKLPG